MSPRLRLYVLAVGVVSLLVVATFLPAGVEHRWPHYLAWTVIAFLCETLWFSSLSGQGMISVASTANLVTLMLWGPGAAVWITATSTLAASRFLQRRPWVKAAFNAGQMAITMATAGAVMSLLGWPADGVESVTRAELAGLPVLAVGFAGMVAIYMLVNRVLVSIAVAWSADRPVRRVLREDWFYRERLYDDLALFLLSPIMMISYAGIGYLGVALFFAPLRLVHESHKRYVALRLAQKAIVEVEVAVAKGQHARKLGHELRGHLVPISGRAQLLIRDSERGVFSNVERHAQIILEQANRMRTMAEDILNAREETFTMQRLDINALVRRAVEIVRTQEKFEGVEWELRLPERQLEARGDYELLRECLMNLFLNAAEAMIDHGTSVRRIAVSSELDREAQRVRLLVRDSGPGIPPQYRTRVFDASFTMKSEGHGFGLSKTAHVIARHGGEIGVADTPAGQGACFVITLPLQGPPAAGTPGAAAA